LGAPQGVGVGTKRPSRLEWSFGRRSVDRSAQVRTARGQPPRLPWLHPNCAALSRWRKRQVWAVRAASTPRQESPPIKTRVVVWNNQTTADGTSWDMAFIFGRLAGTSYQIGGGDYLPSSSSFLPIAVFRAPAPSALKPRKRRARRNRPDPEDDWTACSESGNTRAACRERLVAQHSQISSYDGTPVVKSDRLPGAIATREGRTAVSGQVTQSVCRYPYDKTDHERFPQSKIPVKTPSRRVRRQYAIKSCAVCG